MRAVRPVASWLQCLRRMKKMTGGLGIGIVRGLGLHNEGNADQSYTWQGKRWNEKERPKKVAGFVLHNCREWGTIFSGKYSGNGFRG